MHSTKRYGREYANDIRMHSACSFICSVQFDYSELHQCFHQLNESSDCRAIVLSGAGKHFTAGLDLQSALQMGQDLGDIDEVGRRGHYLGKKIKSAQVNGVILLCLTRPLNTRWISGSHLVSGAVPETDHCWCSFGLCGCRGGPDHRRRYPILYR